MNTTRRDFTKGSALTLGLMGFGTSGLKAQDISAADARAIAKEAYIYGLGKDRRRCDCQDKD